MNKILVIEDEKPVRDTINEILSLGGYKVESASNGRIGLDKARKMIPDLVLCDVVMPVLDGWQTAEAFRQIPELKYIPFVFLSALSTMPDFRRGMNLGADDYLTKPFDHNELLAIISRQLEKVVTRNELHVREGDNRVKKALNDFKGKVKHKTKEFFESMDRAKVVQNAILPGTEQMNELFPDHFNYYVPKYSIAGDFYWVKKIDGITLVAVADCTGHGIPAALISMVCYDKLNTAVDHFGFRNPAEILTKVNELVAEYMGTNREDGQGDGMDISLCAIDHDNKLIRYGGAQRPIYFVANVLNPVHLSDGRFKVHQNNEGHSLFEIKGSGYPIGHVVPGFEIKEQVFKYKKGDAIYLSSDGFVDQFGGDADKKFKSRNLRNLLLSFRNTEMNEQGQLLAQAFETWKGDQEQTDDVTVLGIRL